MNEEFEYKGYWWLPETPDKKTPGVLRFTPSEGVNLELQGSLDDSAWTRIGSAASFLNPPLILGIAATGQLITLFRCIDHGSSIGSGGETANFWAEWAFVNAHFDSVNEVKFKSVAIHYTYLDMWINKPGFEINRDSITNGKLVLKYERPPSFIMPLDDFELIIDIAGPLVSGEATRELRVGQKAWINLKSLAERPLDEFMTVFHEIQSFLSLAIAHPAFPLDVAGTVAVLQDGEDIQPQHDMPVEIYYQLPWPLRKTERLHSFDMLFTFSSAQDRLAEYISNWMQAAELLKPVRDLYFSTLYNPQIYVEVKFLMLSQAIETYHRRRIGGEYEPNETYRKGLYNTLVAALPSDLDESFRQSLKGGRLYYANEYSLRKRLQSHVDGLAAFHFKFLDSSFVDRVCDTRNYLTHYDPDLKEKSAQGKEIYFLSKGLRTLLETCFLRELGFADQAILKMLSDNPAHRDLFLSGQLG